MADDRKQQEEAYRLHQQGKLDQAAELYNRLIAQNPRNYDALHFLGVLKAASGHFEEARRLIERSLAADAVNLPYLENYASILFQSGDYEQAARVCATAVRENRGTETLQYVLAISLHKLGRLIEALDAFDSLLGASPLHLAGNNEKAATLSELKRYNEALACVEKALEINPRYAEAYLNKGNILTSLKKYNESITAYEKALSFNSKLSDAHLGLANACRQLKRFDHALKAYDAALVLMPNFAEAWIGRGNALTELDRLDEALAAYDKALSLNHKMAEAWLGRGNALGQLSRVEESLVAYDSALALKPDLDLAWLGRGNAFMRLKDFERALAAFDRASVSNPALAAAWMGRGNVLNELKRYEDASAAYDSAINLDPALADAYWYKGLVKLCIGDFASGWDLFEWRSKSKEYVSYYPHLKALNIASLQERSAFIGKSVAVFSEQGVGDEIMFASILPDLINDANTVFYQVDPRLVRLFESAFPTAKIIARGSSNDEPVREQTIDMVIQAGSLGYAYRREAASFPRLPYLKAELTRIDKWQARLSKEAGSRLRVGISWRGGTAQTRRDDRSIDLERLRPLIERDDCYFVSLQYGDVGDELTRFNSGAGKAHRLLDDFNNFDEFAALITALDVVISVQNTTIHMCGALGKTCWGMVPWRPEWRYGDHDKSMIWYSTIELFRQRERGDWSSVISSVNSNLVAFIGGRRNVRTN
jgi:tetratricopeptide (TPR) repeat protein